MRVDIWQQRENATETSSMMTTWNDAGRPKSGSLYEKKIASKKEVRNWINALKARKDRLQSESIDDKFRERAKSRFCTPREGTHSGSRLEINGRVSTSHSDVMAAWISHFEALSRSRVSESSTLQDIQSQSTHLHASSLVNEDFVLDVPITVEEIEGVVKKLKWGKCGGPDGILPERITYGGFQQFSSIAHERQNVKDVRTMIMITINAPFDSLVWGSLRLTPIILVSH